MTAPTAPLRVSQVREPRLRVRDNPLLVAQARRRLRVRSALPGALVVVVLLFCGVLFAAIEGDDDGWRGLQVAALVVGGLVLYLRGTMRVAGVAAEERLGGLLDFHRATPTTPWTDAVGYLLGVPAREYLLFAMTVPFFLLGTLAAGDPVPAHLAAVAVLLLSGVVYHAVALVAGLAMERRWSASGIAILFVIVLLGGWIGFVESGLTAFAYLTPFPALVELFGPSADLHEGLAPVSFFGVPLAASVFTLLVQGYLIAFLLVAAARRVGRDDAALLSRPGAFAFLGIGLVLLVGSAWGEPGDIFGSPHDVEAAQVGVLYLLVAGTGAVVLQLSLVPTWLEYARAHRRARKAGRRRAAWLSDGATTVPLPLAFGAIVLAGLALLVATAPARAAGELDLGPWPLLVVATIVLFLFFAGGAAEWIRLRYRRSWRGVAFLVGFLTLVLPWIVGALFMAGARNDEVFLWTAALSPVYGAGYALTMAADTWSFGFFRGGAPLGPFVLSLGVTAALAIAFHLLAAAVRSRASETGAEPPPPSP